MKNIKQSRNQQQSLIAAITALGMAISISSAVASTTYSVDEDVMTSSFFQGANSVRGYAGEGRSVFRVSTNNPFGTQGGETIYLDFGNADFSSFSGTVQAELTVQSAAGGFGGDASAGNPFTVSAHAVNANPIASITDDTNPGGPINWLDFYSNNIETADTAAFTSVDSFGAITFDVSAIVNDWISGSNTIQSLALTGINDTSGNDFLHGFLNNSENAGSSYLTVSSVPIPGAVWLMGSGLIGFMGMARTRKS
jgi:hypothetical protein